MEKEEIIEAINKVTGIDITNPRRNKELVEARALYYTIAKQLLPKVTLQELGKAGNKHHATVIHNLKQYDILEKYNPTLKKQKNRVYNLLQQDFRPVSSSNYKQEIAEYKILISLLKEENNNLKEKLKKQELRSNIKVVSDIEELITNSTGEERYNLIDKLKAFYNINSKLKYQ